MEIWRLFESVTVSPIGGLRVPHGLPKRRHFSPPSLCPLRFVGSIEMEAAWRQPILVLPVTVGVKEEGAASSSFKRVVDSAYFPLCADVTFGGVVEEGWLFSDLSRSAEVVLINSQKLGWGPCRSPREWG